MSLQRGTRLGNYEVLSKLGSGGMGEVYRARDTKLGREIAIKILPQEMASDSQRLRRFEQEARAASALNHPNIVTIYEIGENEGTPYIAMEYVEGRTLRELLSSGPLPNDELIRYATQMAEGLAKAHQAGIVHRDLKPENIVVSMDGYVKILDFGLAKLLPGGDEGTNVSTLAKETTPGAILGTVGYMSPEQAKGEPADFRSDQFSLGAIFYEMATGNRAFSGATAADRLSGVLRDEPKLSDASGASIGRVVQRCLSKSPDDRYTSTTEIWSELAEAAKRIASTPMTRRSIAVVPFRNLSTEKDTEYFSDGLSEDIMLDLAKISELRVISRASAMAFKGTDEPLSEVGRTLDVEYILEGSVRRSGDSVRITAQLIDIAGDAHLWGERYSGSMERVFEFQEEISRKIVEALKLTLSPKESEQLSRRAIDDIEAYEIFLKARPHIWSYTEDGLAQAQRLLLEAIERIGDNEVLYGAMGMTHWQYINAGVRPDEINLEKAREYRDKVAAIRPGSSVGLFLEGLLNLTSGTWASAIRSFKRSLAEQPGNADALFWMCLVYLFAGKSHNAAPYIETLLQIDPLTTQNQVLPGWVEVMDGRLPKGAELLGKVLESSPEHPVVLMIVGTLLARLEERERAFSLFDRLHELVPGSIFDGMARFCKGALLKDKESALAAAAETDLLNKALWDWQLCWEVAAGYALLGETAESMLWLRNAVDRGFTNYPFLSEYDPFLESLRERSEFQELMGEVRAKWEAFDA